MLIVDNFRGKNLDLSECQVEGSRGDNPLVHFSPYLDVHSLPLFTTDSVMWIV